MVEDPRDAMRLPSMRGRTVLVTGANSGLGYRISETMISLGADVVMAGRSRERLEMAKASLPVGGGDVSIATFDLGDIDAIRSFGKRFSERHDRLDILFNNAGVMAPPSGSTKDGFETQIGVNHLGHFALTAALMGALMETPSSRVLTTTSMLNMYGRIPEDIAGPGEPYIPWISYGRSKLANLIFAFELDRRFKAAEVDCISLAWHPGVAVTNLFRHGGRWMLHFAQPPESGVLPGLYAAMMPDVSGGEYLGPSEFFELRGETHNARVPRRARDIESTERLWMESVRLVGADPTP